MVSPIYHLMHAVNVGLGNCLLDSLIPRLGAECFSVQTDINVMISCFRGFTWSPPYGTRDARYRFPVIGVVVLHRTFFWGGFRQDE